MAKEKRARGRPKKNWMEGIEILSFKIIREHILDSRQLRALNKIQNLFKLSTKCVSSASAEHGTKFEADKPDKPLQETQSWSVTT